MFCPTVASSQYLMIPMMEILLTFLRILEKAVALISTNCCTVLVAGYDDRIPPPYLKLGQVSSKLSEPFF